MRGEDAAVHLNSLGEDSSSSELRMETHHFVCLWLSGFEVCENAETPSN